MRTSRLKVGKPTLKRNGRRGGATKVGGQRGVMVARSN